MTRSMSYVQTLTVTHADVLYVNQQIKRDLMALRVTYPRLVSERTLNETDISIGILLMNNAVKTVGFSIGSRRRREPFIYHELKYVIDYSGAGPRTGKGGRPLARSRAPFWALFYPWVHWSDSMLSLSQIEQQRILEGTTWGLPGQADFHPRYSAGQHEFRATYASGPLSARSSEYRR
jgi:hypothetical protein